MPQGRPSKYNPKYHIPWAKGLLRRGLTIDEVAKEFEVSKQTLYNWADQDSDFFDALNESRDKADMEVEKSLYERALGYKVTDRKTVIQLDKNTGEQKPARIEVIEKEIPPDVTACIFWLKNRNPKNWRDKQDIQIDEMSDAGIKDWIKAIFPDKE